MRATWMNNVEVKKDLGILTISAITGEMYLK